MKQIRLAGKKATHSSLFTRLLQGRRSLKMRLIAYFLLVAVLVGVVGYFGYSGVQGVFENFDVIADETAPEISLLGIIKARAERLQAEALSFTLINAELEKTAAAELEEFEETNKELDEAIAELEEIEEGDELHEADEQELVENIKESKAELYNAALALVNAKKEGKSGQEILDLKEELEEAEEGFRAIIKIRLDFAIEELEERDEFADALAATTKNVILIISFIAIILSIGLGLFVSNKITKLLLDLTQSNQLIIQGKFEEAREQGFTHDLPRELQDLVQTREKALSELVGKQRIEETNKQLLNITNELKKRVTFDEKKRIAMASILEDVDAQKKIIEKANKELYTESLYPKMNPGPVLQLNMSGQVLASNPAATKIYGKINQQSFFNISGLDAGMIIHVLKKKKLYRTEIGFKNKFYQVTLRKDPKADLLFAYSTDITKRKDMANQLRDSYDKLHELDIAKDEFIMMTSHELKSPLFPILGSVELLQGGELGKINKEQQKKLVIIQHNVELIQKRIDEFLDLSRLELRKIRLEKKKHDMVGLTKEIVEGFRPYAKVHKATISISAPKKLVAVFDKERIIQVLQNLIKNAIIYGREGKENLIKVKVSSKRNHVAVEIKDNGKGIDKKNLSKVFDKFYRADEGYHRKQGGLGMGLAVCKGLIKLHKGAITVTSNKGRGSTFRFTLPNRG